DLVGLVIVNRQPVAFVDAHPVDVATLHFDVAGGRRVGAGDELEQSRLARAVRPHHADDAGLLDAEIRFEAKRLLRRQPAALVYLCEIADFEHRRHGYIPIRSRRRAGSSMSSRAGPSWTIRPWSMT